jgi:hypothetical protein
VFADTGALYANRSSASCKAGGSAAHVAAAMGVGRGRRIPLDRQLCRRAVTGIASVASPVPEHNSTMCCHAAI